MTIDYTHFKERLEEELKLVEEELKEVGEKDPDNPSDWRPKPEERDTSQADENTVADSVEDYEENWAIVNTLERRYNDINKSLKAIEGGTYGKCGTCGEEISVERLEANPSAQTCKAHM